MSLAVTSADATKPRVLHDDALERLSRASKIPGLLEIPLFGISHHATAICLKCDRSISSASS